MMLLRRSGLDLASHEIDLRRLTHPMASSWHHLFILPHFHSTPTGSWSRQCRSRFRHRPSQTEVTVFILVLHRAFQSCTVQFIHDTPRKRGSPGSWFVLLGTSHTVVDFSILLWCVLLARGTKLIHMFDNRCVSCTLLCIGRYLCVRFPQCAYSLARPDAPKSHRRRGFFRRATAMFVTTVINLLLFSLSTGAQVAITILVFQEPVDLVLDSPLSEIPIPRPGLTVNSGTWSTILVAIWATFLPVSTKLSPSDSVSIHALWRYGSAI